MKKGRLKAVMKIDKKQVFEMIKPIFVARDQTKNKSDFGQGIVVGGSSNYVGAPQFSADALAEILVGLGKASMLSGIGTSVLAVPEFLANAFYSKVRYSAIYPLKTNGKSIVFDRTQFENLVKKNATFAIGMGMADGEADKIVNYLLKNSNCNIIIDADALAKTREFDFDNRAILTPHIGEMAKLVDTSAENVIENAEKICLEYAKQHNAVVVLKNYVTTISDGKAVYKCHFGNSKLAKGGSGDVLDGIILGLAGFSKNLLLSAVAGCYILGQCAENSKTNEFSHTVDDIINQIPSVIDDIIALNSL